MGKKKHLMGPAAGRIGKLVGDKLNAGDFAKGAKNQLKKSSDEVVQKVRRVSKRLKYLGSTPGKASRTGREVIDRMRREGKIRKIGGEDQLIWTNPRTGKPEMYPLKDTDMGHYPVDAVTYWNTTGIKHGPKSQEVRDWMLDPKNYELQPSWYNRSEGAKLGARYNDPKP